MKAHSKTTNLDGLQTNPGILVKSNLLGKSQSDDFETAKTEWDLIEQVPSDSEDFVENCELCNHRNYKGNWLIQNRYTKSTLKVGSDCITRFVVLNGAASLEDSNTFFENKKKELDKELKVKAEYHHIILNRVPTKREAKSFTDSLLFLLDAQGKKQKVDSLEGIKEIIINICDHPYPDKKEIQDLYTLINEPESLTYQKETKRFKNYKLREGETWKKKGKVTATTLSPSGAYKPDRRY